MSICSAEHRIEALPPEPRLLFLHWCNGQVAERRHLLAQNSRFLVRPATGRWPNLATRVLKRVCERLSADWQTHFGHPVLRVGTFFDPLRFAGTCYQAANWEVLGPTQGYERRGQDFYLDRRRPKELWVYPLGPEARGQLQAPVLAEPLREGGLCPPPPVPVPTAQMSSLTSFLHERQRKSPRGKGSLPDGQRRNLRQPNSWN